MLINTILANHTSGGNAGGVISDGGHNLSSDASFRFPEPTSLNRQDPLLGILAQNGGLTPTLALSTNSPAINAGNDSVAWPTDQRGARRFGRSDIGAFEFHGLLAEMTLSMAPAGTTNLVLTWPVSNLNTVLESTVSLVPPVAWDSWAGPVLQTNALNRAVIQPAGTGRFFRLRSGQ